MTTPVLIVGGGTGGAAAAIACSRAGVACVVTEPTEWIGGQLTAQGVPPDENQWIETYGGTRAYQSLRTAVRRMVAAHPHADPARVGGERLATLNPGGGWVSRLCAPPRLWHAALGEALGPAVASGLVRVLTGHEPIRAEVNGDRVEAVTFAARAGGPPVVVRAGLVLDATEQGDLLALAGVEHALGAEHRDAYGELSGRSDFDFRERRCDELDQQACSWCFALEHRPGEDHTIARPERYAWWRAYVPQMEPRWCGPLFSWTVPSHNVEGRRTFRMVPWPDTPHQGEWEMWRYRRIVDTTLYLAAHRAEHPDTAVINMVQMDYWLRPLLGATLGPVERDAALAEAREQSRCFLYWMQTEAPRHDSADRAGYPGLRLRGDELGTPDGFAMAPYIREPRRLLARTVVTEAHVGTEQRRRSGLATKELSWEATPFGTAERFADTVGIGHYMIDLHPSCAGRNNVYVPAAPFRIPMGALIPVRARNVLAAGKCLGVTHVANGAYRMHAVEWNVGESAGALAAWCVRTGTEPQAVHADELAVADVQRALAAEGVRLSWPWET